LPTLSEISAELLAAIESAKPRLLALDAQQAAVKPAPEKWSPKEIIGHLIDSAANNHQRFVRAQHGVTDLLAYRHAQNHWVEAQQYQSADWQNLVALWYAFNVHLAHVIACIRPEFLDEPLLVWDEPATPRFVAEDYVRHLRHHLGQIDIPELRSGAVTSPERSSGIQFQKMSITDLPLIQHYGRATYEPYYPHIWKPGGLDWYIERCFGTETLQAELADPNIEYLLPTDAAGQVIGLLKLVLKKPVPDHPMENALYLEKIYLMPNFFGKGMGQRLIEWVVDQAKNLGREAVWLTVMQTGPRSAYERAGFHTIGATRYEFDILKEAERNGWVMVRTVDC